MPDAFNTLQSEAEQIKKAKELQRQQDIEASNVFLKKSASRDYEDRKFAADHSSDIIRIRNRELSIMKQLNTWTRTTNDDLVEQFETLENMRYYDYEIDSPMSMSLGLYGNPMNYSFSPRKGAMKFHKHMTPRMTIDPNELRTVKWDIRRFLLDNTVRDVSLSYDAEGLAAWQRCVGAYPGQVMPWSSATQWVQLPGGFDRSTAYNIKHQMNRVQFDTGFGVANLLMNHDTALAQGLLGFEQMGGDLAQDMLVNGVTKDLFGGLKCYYTIKRGMVGDGTIWAFTSEDKFMRCSYLEELTMMIENSWGQIEFSAMDNSGMLIVNPKNVIRFDLQNLAV
jgi:hypothetical protein